MDSLPRMREARGHHGEAVPGRLYQAFYITRLCDGLLDDYQMIELMSSAEMAEALARVPGVKAQDSLESSHA